MLLLPDWTQLFAETLSRRPDLLDQLNNASSVDDGTESKFDRGCSLDLIESRRSWLLEDISQQCRSHEPIECPGHVRIISPPGCRRRACILPLFLFYFLNDDFLSLE